MIENSNDQARMSARKDPSLDEVGGLSSFLNGSGNNSGPPSKSIAATIGTFRRARTLGPQALSGGDPMRSPSLSLSDSQSSLLKPASSSQNNPTGSGHFNPGLIKGQQPQLANGSQNQNQQQLFGSSSPASSLSNLTGVLSKRFNVSFLYLCSTGFSGTFKSKMLTDTKYATQAI